MDLSFPNFEDISSVLILLSYTKRQCWNVAFNFDQLGTMDTWPRSISVYIAAEYLFCINHYPGDAVVMVT